MARALSAIVGPSRRQVLLTPKNMLPSDSFHRSSGTLQNIAAGMAALLAAAVLAGCMSLKSDVLKLEGARTQGGLLLGRTVPGTAVRLGGRALRLTPEGVFVFGFGRDAPEQTELELKRPDGSRLLQLLQVTPRSYREQHVRGVPPRTVSPPQNALARIRAEREQLHRARSVDSSRTDFADSFAWPLKGIITGVFGSRRIYDGQPRRPHYGVDIAAPAGTPVRAPAGGLVQLAHPDMFFSGGTLLLDHGHGLNSSFLHLSKIHVQKGQEVRKGQLIAEVGATGRVTGPHLHWQMNWFHVPIDAALAAGPMEPVK